MRQSYSSESMASTSDRQKPRKRKWTREQLLRNLEILGTLPTPLPPTLPPSPPASRSSSPVPATKRKSDTASDQESVKRPRTSWLSDQSHHRPQHLAPPRLPLGVPDANSAFSVRAEPCEDGEVREEPMIASSSRGPSAAVIFSPAVPVRRPKRGRLSTRYFDVLHDKYHNAGRMLKYSGDARFWSTYPATHREYRPLADPPPPNSPYHKHGGLIARLELVDALVCFTYSIWNKDYSRRHCNKDTWGTIEAFLVWCKQKWQAEEGINDAEKAFVGLIWMIEAFIHGRKMTYSVRTHLDGDMDKLMSKCKSSIAAAAAEAEENPPAGSNTGLLALKSQATPPMLPSPASIAPANSANSTPTNRAGDTPNTTSRSASTSSTSAARPMPSNPGPSIPITLLPSSTNGAPIPSHVMTAMASVTVPVGPTLVQDLKDQTSGIIAAAWCMNTSQSTLTLPTMARFFPTTFARMIHSSLSPNEEHEPDFEDEEGELFWPGQSITGEGLGWVCLMGKAMIKEFGKAYGYRGLDGVVPKPKPEEQTEDGPPAPPAQGASHLQGQGLPPRPVSTPQGQGPAVSLQR